MIDLHRLRVFRAVVAAGSISAASESLGYTKSAISQQLNAFARETGLTLFVRSGRGLSLTGAGKELFDASRTLVREHAALETLVDSLNEGRRSPLVLGTFASAGEALLPQVLAELSSEYTDPPVNVVLSDIAPPATRPDVDLRVEVPGQETPVPHGYTRVEITTDPYVAVLPPAHRLADRPAIRLGELKDEKWIRDDVAESPCSVIAAMAWHAAGFAPTSVIQAADHHSAIAFVAAGLGVCIMPRLAAKSAAQGVRIVEVQAPTPRRTIVAHLHDSVNQHPLASALITRITNKLAETTTPAP
ncbi:MAG TPA: LysR family transcriptional regulator [Dietzia timorensis]|jgi:DNA-binding transcriptional LysR family regulator|uniref:LysR family transcriptional regulator n=1 Tax=Dietzia timorensis TaxID=499555 RepID=A0A921JYR8_9ACTN|nr:LysR family transcriptional regulator [Dietzia timorensis]HJE90156.1 LysR family transcriptional regulator [Dietzia timorensis]